MPNHVLMFVSVSAVGGVLAFLIVRWRGGKGLEVWLGRIGMRTVLASFLTAVISGLLYSIVHESGHALFGVLLGGTVESVTWTIFSGVEPQVSFSHLPPSAEHWTWAGGYLVPTGVALVCMTVWFVCLRGLRSARFGLAVLLVPASVLLVCNLGCLPELFAPTSHLRSVASCCGLGKTGEVILATCLASVSLALMGMAVWAARCRVSASNLQRGAPPNGGTSTPA